MHWMSQTTEMTLMWTRMRDQANAHDLVRAIHRAVSMTRPRRDLAIPRRGIRRAPPSQRRWRASRHSGQERGVRSWSRTPCAWRWSGNSGA